MVLSTAPFGKPAFRNLICNGLVLAEDEGLWRSDGIPTLKCLKMWEMIAVHRKAEFLEDIACKLREDWADQRE
nr:isoleucine--tRNA ligase, cytoplasmic [Tanacetum cinerariifolium]